MLMNVETPRKSIPIKTRHPVQRMRRYFQKCVLQSLAFTFTFTFTCEEGDHKSGHPALTPLHGPSAQPQQTSRLTEPLKSFHKL